MVDRVMAGGIYLVFVAVLVGPTTLSRLLHFGSDADEGWRVLPANKWI